MARGSTVLTSIRTIDELLRFLEEELDWPINGYDKEDLAFVYSAEELGLKEEEAAKIKGVFQLRPLEHGQPWGIFFIEFEKKKLPIVVMRRILSALVEKRRRNKTKQHTWDKHDLLFISRHGEDDDPHITFAHFEGDENSADIPKLKVLGWDGDDTVLKLDHVMRELRDKLRWPESTKDFAAWRKTWTSAFTLRHNEVIRTSQELALHLAELARGIRNRALRVLAMETKKGRLRALMQEFKDALIHDLKDDSFADMYAQTISYGLLAARVSRPAGVIAENVKDMVPMTNPFLRDMLSIFLTAGGRDRKNGMDFDELGVQDVVELLNHCNMEAVLRDFGNRTRQEDPVIHFYELFLKAYDAEMKVKRGVFYTPQPVVSFIVRSVHKLLQTEFGLEDGFASTVTWEEMAKKHFDLKIPEGTSPKSPFVVILDPATGTGTFLVEVIDVIHRTVVEKWKKAGLKEAQIKEAWNRYVPTNLLPRLFGYELMMAPYAIAHMKIGLKLYETGYTFPEGEEARANIYLTNALEPASDSELQVGLDFYTTPLAEEAKAVNEVKRNQHFTVVIGNPPYAQYSMNLTPTAKTHIEKFRYANGQKIRARNALQLERNLNDDYVKFLGFASNLFPLGTGVQGMITNRMFLDSESLVGLREWFAKNFCQMYLLDLWGSSEESRRIERLAMDENVFDILQGVAITFAVKRRATSDAVRPTLFREVIGKREDKYVFLGENLVLGGPRWEETLPQSDDWWLHRAKSDEASTARELTIAEIFPQFSTLVGSNRDHLVVDLDKDVVLNNVKTLRTFNGSNKEWSKQFGIKLKKGWNVSAAREKLSAICDLSAHIKPIEYRAFDKRWIFFHSSLVWQMAPVSSNNVLNGRSNRVLISLGKNRSETTNGHWVSSTLADKSVVSSRDNASGFPLYLFDNESEGVSDSKTGVPNIAPEFLRHLANKLNLRQKDGSGMLPSITPEDIFNYIYATLHSPGYRKHYAEFLKIDFPRLPVTGEIKLFHALVQLGGELVSLHLMESPKLNKHISYFTGKGDNSIPKKAIFKDGAVWINSTQRFEGVPEAVWNFYIGGYQICEKWLKDRKGRTLSAEDIDHYNKIVVALNETIRLMKEIDEVIEKHGGWPGAFVSNKQEDQGLEKE